MIRLEGMRRLYGDLVAVDGISFEVRRGEMFGLIGPDGAGKTTTLKVVLGLLHPHAGTVSTCGLDPARQGRALSRRVGYLSQRFSLYGDLSVDENVAFFAEVHGVKGWRARRDELLELLRMSPFRKRLSERLSGGMKQKLALACTLIHAPELLVLDEPTTGVDPVSRRDFWKILAHLQRQGMTVLLTTPYLEEAERCQRVALIDRGRLLTVDSPDNLRENVPGTILEVLARPKSRVREILERLDGITDIQVFGERLHVSFGGLPASEAAQEARRLASKLAEAGVEVEAVRPTPPSLEDIFIASIRAADSRIRAAGSPSSEVSP